MSIEQVRVVSIVEGTWVTGPIKPLLMFARMARDAPGEMAVSHSLMTTARLAPGQPEPANKLIDASRAAGLEMDVVVERRAWDAEVVRRMVEHLRRRKPHIVETHQVKCHFLLTQALLWGGLPRDFAWIAYHHGYTQADLKLRLYEELDRLTLRHADHVVTMCQPFAAQLRRRGVEHDRLSVISNAIEPKAPAQPEEIQRLRTQLGLRPDDRILVAVGRLSPEKAHRVLIEAFASLPPVIGSALHLVLVGDGPERAALEQQAAPLRERVHFAGHQQDVWPYYFLADLFVLPSLTEGSPLVLFEALAAGTPVVATSVGGVPETIETGKSGLLVPPGDAAALAKAMQQVLGDEALRQQLRRGALQASERFSPQQYRANLLKTYKNVLSQRSGR